jgi:lysophospholipase L1-like esterase
MIAALQAGAPKARLIWANTTPVLHDSQTGESTNSRIDQRNRLAAKCMAREGIPTDDQHALMLPHPELHDGDVHFTAAGSALQATNVTEALRPLLPKH